MNNLFNNWGIHDIFSVPIYSAILDNSTIEKIQLELDEKVPFINESFGGKPTYWKNDVDSSFGKSHLIRDYKLDLLSEVINLHLDNYISQISYGIDGLFMIDSWINKNNKNQSQEHHTHISPHNEIISGVYYNKSTGNEGNILFHNFNIEYLTLNPSKGKYMSEYYITPVTGAIILFPSSIIHSVEVNNTENDRQSIAFNFSRMVVPQ